jgi:hypothetical protein
MYIYVRSVASRLAARLRQASASVSLVVLLTLGTLLGGCTTSGPSDLPTGVKCDRISDCQTLSAQYPGYVITCEVVDGSQLGETLLCVGRGRADGCRQSDDEKTMIFHPVCICGECEADSTTGE